jgi:lysophospholipase L1-like esterase
MNKLWTFGDSFTWGYGCREDNIIESDGYGNTFKNYFDTSKLIWPELIGSKFNLEVSNHGRSGATNDYILDTILKNFLNFKKNDIVVIQASSSGRYSFPFPKKKGLIGFEKLNHWDEIYSSNNKSPYYLHPLFMNRFIKDYEKGGSLSSIPLNSYQLDPKKTHDNLILNKKKYELIRDFFSEFISTEKYYDREIWRFIQIGNILTFLGINVCMIHLDRWSLNTEKPEYLISASDNGLGNEIKNKGLSIFKDTNGMINDYHPSYSGHEYIAEEIIKYLKKNNII